MYPQQNYSITKLTCPFTFYTTASNTLFNLSQHKPENHNNPFSFIIIFSFFLIPINHSPNTTGKTLFIRSILKSYLLISIFTTVFVALLMFCLFIQITTETLEKKIRFQINDLSLHLRRWKKNKLNQWQAERKNK